MERVVFETRCNGPADRIARDPNRAAQAKNERIEDKRRGIRFE